MDMQWSMICDNGKPVFEDTNCKAGEPDKDHRNNQAAIPCCITITAEEIQKYCNE